MLEIYEKGTKRIRLNSILYYNIDLIALINLIRELSRSLIHNNIDRVCLLLNHKTPKSRVHVIDNLCLHVIIYGNCIQSKW